MEEPFPKRPRLSIFADGQTDTRLDDDLGVLRYKNDYLLKSRFESIFEKYSHDFSGVGDEIDIVKGKVVVNNGHLESMEDETDIGDAPQEDETGKKLLKAMSGAPDGAKDGANTPSCEDIDSVISSIEAVAENAAPPDDGASMEDGEEDTLVQAQLQVPHLTSRDHKPPASMAGAFQGNYKEAEPDDDESDKDSLFEVQVRQRSTSPDSLFEVGLSGEGHDTTTHSSFESSHLGDDRDESAILQKYGPGMGREVLEMLRKARSEAVEAQVEPAWRLPADLLPSKQTTSRRSASNTPSKLTFTTPLHGDMPSSEPGRSLWRSNIRQISPRLNQQTQRHRRMREESVDPLLECVSTDHSRQLESGDQPKEEESEEEVVEWISNRSNGRGNDEQVLQMKQGICFYCSRQWKTRASVFRHWLSLVLRAEEFGAPPDDVHDMEYIRGYCSSAQMGPRGPRLSVDVLKSLVELHEGAGQSFDEIADSGLVRTKKNGPQLREAYVKYRKPRGKKGKVNAREWSQSELETLNQLCQSPRSTVSAFGQVFEGRSAADVVDKLAEIWLKEFNKSAGTAEERPESPKPQKRASRTRSGAV